MADWFRCRPLPLLDALGNLSDDAALLYVKALLLIYSHDGRIPSAALARTSGWRADRFKRVLGQLLDSGKLIGTASGDLHNDYAMHELQQLAEINVERALSGSKGGRVRAERERQARKIAARNQSPDLPMKLPETEPELPQNGARMAVERQLYSHSGPTNAQSNAQNTNEINETDQAQLNPARAIELESEVERKIPPVVPRDQNDENEDGFEIPPTPRRKPNCAIPDEWQPPTIEQLTPMVRDRVERWPGGVFDREREKFVTDAHSEDRRHRDWTMAFGKWLLVHDGYLQKQLGGRYEKPAGFKVPKLGGPRS